MFSLEISKLHPIQWIKTIFRSIFTKLLLILIIAGLCITFVVGVAFRVGTLHYRQVFQEHFTLYINYLVQDIGNPPNYEKAKQLANQYSLRIHYKGVSESWSTSSSFPAIKKMHFRPWRKFPQVRFSRYRGNYLVMVQQEGGQLFFSIDLHRKPEKEREMRIISVLILLPLILILTYITIRLVLKPVKWLNEGVREVAEGNLKHRVPEKRSDELGDLSKAFNTMTDRIDHMLQSKEQLLLDVSHEFRSPLTRIKVALEFMEEHPIKSGIQEDVNELERMVSEILETARLDSAYGHLNRQKTDLLPLIQEVLATFHPSSAIVLEARPEPFILNIDPNRIKIVLQNIINNALKYSPNTHGAVRIGLRQEKSHTILTIQDSGEGIPQEELPYLFEPFYRVDKSRSKETGGYGLGLPLCKKIMEAHEGKIEITSKPSEGTTLTLFFPLIS